MQKCKKNAKHKMRKINKLVNLGRCSIDNRKKSMTVSDNTIMGEGLQDFFKNLGKKGPNLSKSIAEIVLKNPSRALDFTANIASAAASKNPTNVLSTPPEVFKFYQK